MELLRSNRRRLGCPSWVRGEPDKGLTQSAGWRGICKPRSSPDWVAGVQEEELEVAREVATVVAMVGVATVMAQRA